MWATLTFVLGISAAPPTGAASPPGDAMPAAVDVDPSGGGADPPGASDSADVTPPAAARASESLGPAELPPVGLSYSINAQLDPEGRRLTAREILRWRNDTGEAQAAVPVHLYLNAFAHEATTWVRGSQAIRAFDFDALAKVYDDPWGFIRLTQVAQDVGELASGDEEVAEPGGDIPRAHPGRDKHRQPVTWSFIQPDDGNPFDETLAELSLAQPVEPGQELVLVIDFEAQLPAPIARTGGVRGWFHVAQWFPKIGVWNPAGRYGAERGRWGAHQFHGPTEFYADFADFDVRIDVPHEWKVVATGAPADSGREATPGLKRFRFTQRAVHDFAWTTSPDLHVETFPFRPPGGGPEIQISYVVPTGREKDIPRMRVAAEKTFEVLGRRVGPYPYTTMKVVDPPWAALQTGGMEYPTLVTGGPSDPLWDREPLASFRVLEGAIAHEVTHNYFYGLVANDEQEEAFLDEGFTQFWETQIVEELRGDQADYDQLFGRPVDFYAQRRNAVGAQTDRLMESPRRRPAYLFYPRSHGTQIYARSAAIWNTARRRFGQEPVDRIFSTYFKRHRFTHPEGDDFFAVVDEVGPPELSAFAREAYEQRAQPDFRVDKVEVEAFRTPRGYVPSEEGTVRVIDPATEERGDLGAEPAALDETDGVWAERTDPGFRDAGGDRAGVVERIRLPVVAREPVEEEGSGAKAASGEEEKGDEPEKLQRASVRLVGPGWQHLPCVVRFHFDDGTVVEDRWDGRSAWRSYELLRRSKLKKVVLDPDDENLIDFARSNNAWRREPDDERVGAWAMWLQHIGEWLAGGVSLWL